MVPCWKIEPTGISTLYLTAHDSSLVLADGNTYSPVGSLDMSAHSRDSELRDHNVEYRGAITDDAITTEDLIAGRYKEAKITESLVDWLYPWMGHFIQNIYWIGESTFSGEEWECEVSGLTRFLQQPVGRTCDRSCPYDLGVINAQGFGCPVDTDTGASPDVWAYASVVTAVDSDEPRRIFRASGLSSVIDDDWARLGVIEFVTGNNNALKGIIKSFDDVNKEIELIMPMPYNIAIGNSFTITAGCDGTFISCSEKFTTAGNPDIYIDWGGFKFIPGTKRALKTPNA